jgi:hypothetical protein
VSERNTMRRTLITALLVVFICLGIASVLFMYNTHTIPLEEKRVTPLYTHTNRGTYDYVASLKPNTVYDNKTTLKPGEGTVYRRITEQIDVNFTYTFEGSKPTNLTIRYNVTEYVETTKWTKMISEVPIKTVSTQGTEATLSINNISPINASSIVDLVKAMQSDTGIPMSEYSANIRVAMYIEAETSEGVINKTFSPTLAMLFQSSRDEGDIISISGLENSDSDSITKTETIYHSWVKFQRDISYVLSIVALSGLVITTWWFMRTRPHKPPRPEKILEDFIKPYEEIIVETAPEPSVGKPKLEPENTINVETMDDLLKIAEILGKPILHSYWPPEDHIFYVFDDKIRYEFATTISALAERKKILEREEIEWENDEN